MRICPAADLTDGLLDVTVVGPISRSELVRLRPRVYDGSHLGHPAVSTHRAAQVALADTGTALRELIAYADGEPLGPLPVRAECVAGALRVLAPPS
jgi:diacylglycerol kinase (ATP)